MIRAAKKLKKLWPRNKRKKRAFPDSFYYLPPPPPPPPPCQCCCSNSPIQPSAPPLPPWIEQIYQTDVQQYDRSNEEYESQEIVVEEANNHPPLLSYQQYTVSNPVYGVPINVGQQNPTRERTAAGFLSKFIRCFCPCFHVRQLY